MKTLDFENTRRKKSVLRAVSTILQNKSFELGQKPEIKKLRQMLSKDRLERNSAKCLF